MSTSNPLICDCCGKSRYRICCICMAFTCGKQITWSGDEESNDWYCSDCVEICINCKKYASNSRSALGAKDILSEEQRYEVRDHCRICIKKKLKEWYIQEYLEEQRENSNQIKGWLKLSAYDWLKLMVIS